MTGKMVITKRRSESHSQGDINSFRCFADNSRNITRPAGRKRAVYLLSKANPIRIPDHIQYHFLPRNTASYKATRETVQKSISGVSGVDTRKRMVTKKLKLKI